jgi:hypothetical protein
MEEGKQEDQNKMERKRTESDRRMWPTRRRLGGQTSLEIGCRKTLPHVTEERLHTHNILTGIQVMCL